MSLITYKSHKSALYFTSGNAKKTASDKIQHLSLVNFFLNYTQLKCTVFFDRSPNAAILLQSYL